MKCVIWAESLAWFDSNPLDFSNKFKNLWTYSYKVSEGFCWSINIDAAWCLVVTEPKL